jgi:cyclopropane fatty-acyl-phospholipid synthase-like methyltransferase
MPHSIAFSPSRGVLPLSEILETPPTDWYTTFFTELPNEFWRRAVPAEATEADVDFIEQRLGLPAGSALLDVPCGSGRHTLALARRGHRVTGVDISAEAVDHARRAAAEAGVDVELVLGDMRDVPQGGRFDAAVCLGNSFGYLTEPETRTFLAALAGAVRPGGGLVVDVAVAAESILPGFTAGEEREMRTGDIVVAATGDYDVAESRLLSRYVFRRGTEEVAATAVHHLYTSGHLGHLLRDAGFTDVERYAGPDGAPFELGSGRLILTARRA